MANGGVGRNFAFLWSGQVISQLGDSVYHIALVWLAIEMTASPILSSLIVSAGYLPAILFSLAAGTVVDTVNRRRLMIFCALCQALVVAAVPLVHHWGRLSPALLALVSFLLATGSAFFVPARDAIIPHLVEGAKLHRANSLMQMSMQLAYLGGPVLAGALVDFTGIIGLFTVDALSFVASALLLLLIAMPGGVPLHPPAEPVPVPDLPRAAGGSLRDIHQGLAYAWRDGRLRGLLVLTALDNFFIMGAALLGLPIYVREVLQLGPSYYALLTAVLFCGMILASLVVGINGQLWPKGKLIVCGIALDALTFLPLFFVDSFPQAALAMFVHGLTVPLITISRATLVHQTVADRQRGRVFALINLAVVGFTALSVLMVGPLCGWLGVQNMFLLVASSGVLFALGGVAFRQLWRAA
jgi:DHA3 family macrolide efflux protein-like MFS transporter